MEELSKVPETAVGAVSEMAKKLVDEKPEHTTIQRVANGFVISVPGQKHRVAYNLEEVTKHVLDIFAE